MNHINLHEKYLGECENSYSYDVTYHHIRISNCLDLVNIVIGNYRVEAGVQIVQKFNNLDIIKNEIKRISKMALHRLSCIRQHSKMRSMLVLLLVFPNYLIYAMFTYHSGYSD